MHGRAYGIILVSIATVMWSTAGLFVRLLDLDVWSVLGWRSLFGGIVLSLISLAGRSRNAEPTPLPLYLVAGFLSAITMFGYVAALKLTTVANVLAIYATVPFFAAGAAFVWMRERVDRRVLIASAIALVGVLVVAGFGARPQDLAGDGLSLLMTIAFAVFLVMARRHRGLDLAAANAIGSGLCLLLYLPFMPHTLPSAFELGVLALFGATTSGIAYLLFTSGSRYIPAPEAGLIGLLDIVLGPAWVWLAFDENPGAATLAGGALILASVLWYMWGRLRAGRKPLAAGLRASDAA